MDVDVETEARKYVADKSYMLECREWLSNQFDTLTDENVRITVSEWAESTRYLPATLTSMPGYYSFDVTPYLREIADCLVMAIGIVRMIYISKSPITARLEELHIIYFVSEYETKKGMAQLVHHNPWCCQSDISPIPEDPCCIIT